MKSSTLSLSGRSSKIGSAMNSASCSSLQPQRSALAWMSGFNEFLTSLMTADLTFEGSVGTSFLMRTTVY